MEKLITHGDMPPQRFILEGWQYFDRETMQWKLKPDAPEWAKEEFERFYDLLNNNTVDGVTTLY